MKREGCQVPAVAAAAEEIAVAVMVAEAVVVVAAVVDAAAGISYFFNKESNVC